MPAFNCPKFVRPSSKLANKSKTMHNNEYELFFPNPKNNICFACNKEGILICTYQKDIDGSINLTIIKSVTPKS